MKNKAKLYRLILIGHLTINFPIVLFCFLFPYLLTRSFDQILFKVIFAITGFFFAIVISWIYWSYIVKKWGFWTLQQLDEDELLVFKNLAIRNQLIWSTNNFFDGSESSINTDKDELNRIAEKVSELDQIEEVKRDLSTPNEIGYRLSKVENLSESFSFLLIFGVAIGALFTKLYPFGLLILLVMFFNLKNLKYFQRSFVKEDYLELRNEGVKIGFQESGLIKWGNIELIQIHKEQRELEIEYVEDGESKSIKFELWRLKGYDYFEFKSDISVYIERYRLRLLS
jgi:hypothetical protein